MSPNPDAFVDTGMSVDPNDVAMGEGDHFSPPFASGPTRAPAVEDLACRAYTSAATH
jgi:hypothetical protein